MERFYGHGKLTRLREPGVALGVTFDFQIERKIVRGPPGLPPAMGKPNVKGRVTSTEKAAIPEDFYELLADDGRKARLQLLGGTWYLLEPRI
jgi:hypothetical protein